MTDKNNDQAVERTEANPSFRLLRLWLFSTPIVMLALATGFAAVAVINERWGLLAAMIILAIAAIGLFFAQARLMGRIRNQ